jgi:sigma-E factor negative regulatory protein RseA
MNDVLKKRELVSALADGQLRGNDLAKAIQLAGTDPDSQACWHAYHLAGDVMRSAELCRVSSDEAFIERLQSRFRLKYRWVRAPESTRHR